MAVKGGRIDFMFLAPPPSYPAAGSATVKTFNSVFVSLVLLLQFYFQMIAQSNGRDAHKDFPPFVLWLILVMLLIETSGK